MVVTITVSYTDNYLHLLATNYILYTADNIKQIRVYNYTVYHICVKQWQSYTSHNNTNKILQDSGMIGAEAL